jgi:hypothetical protein
LEFSPKGLFLKIGRGEWPNFEPRPAAVRPYVNALSGLSRPYLLAAARLGREFGTPAIHA